MNYFRLSNREWYLVYCSCHCLYDSLDITNTEIKDRNTLLYNQNLKDMEDLDKIMSKIREFKRDVLF